METKIPFSCKVQKFLAKLGIAIHNPFRNECTQDFGCCTKLGKYWLRINQDTMYKFIKTKSLDYDYASNYSRMIWEDLMKRFDENPNFYIGANDVSDYVLNAILNALNGRKYPKRYETLITDETDSCLTDNER